MSALIQAMRVELGLEDKRFQDGIKRARAGAKAFQGDLGGVGRASRGTNFTGISQQLSQIGQSFTATGNLAQSFAVQAADIGGYFGPIGIAAGVATGLLLPFGASLLGAGDAAGDLGENLDDLESAVNRVRAANDNFSVSGLEEVRKKYGEINAEILALIENQRTYAVESARMTARETAAAIREELGDYRAIADLLKVEPTVRIENERSQFGEVFRAINPEVQRFLDLMDAVARDATMEGQADAAADLLKEMRDAGLAGSELFGKLVSAEGALRELSEEADTVPPALTEAGDGAGTLGDQMTRAAEQAERLKAAIDGIDYSNGRRVANEAASRAGRGSYDDLRGAVDNGILDLIAHVEGTDRGRSYNETLDFGRWTQGQVDLVNMTLAEVRRLQDSMRTPENRNLYRNAQGEPVGSSAVGRYQIVSSTLDGLIKELGLSMNELFTPALQDRLALELVRQAGGPNGIRSTWQGFQTRGTPDAAITQALGSSPEIAQAVAEEAAKAERDLAEATREADQARKEAERSAREQAQLTEAAASAFENLVASIDPTAASNLQFAEAQERVNDAIARGVISATEGAAAMEAFGRYQLENSEAAQLIRAANEEQLRSAAEAAAEFEGIWKGGITSVVDWMADGFEGGFDGLLDIGRGVLDQLVTYFRDNPLPINAAGDGGGGGLLGSISGALGGPLGIAASIGSGLLGMFGRKRRERREREEREEQERLREEEAMYMERRGIRRQKYQAQGNTAMLREMDMQDTRPENRSRLRELHAIEDAAAAEEALTRAREEAAAIAERIADEAKGLQFQLWELTGDTLAVRRAEMMEIDPANRALWKRIEALKASRAAEEEAAAVAERIAAEGLGLDRRILELQGDTQALRALELAALDPLNRSRQLMIYGLEDMKDRMDAAREAMEALDPQDYASRFEFQKARGLAAGQVSTGTATMPGGVPLVTVPSVPLSAVSAEDREMLATLREIRDVQRQGFTALDRNTYDTKTTLRKFDAVGMPPERT